MLTARDFLVFCWGATLSSGIWACCWWDGIPFGPGHEPIGLIPVALATLATAFFWGVTLWEAANPKIDKENTDG